MLILWLRRLIAALVLASFYEFIAYRRHRLAPNRVGRFDRFFDFSLISRRQGGEKQARMRACCRFAVSIALPGIDPYRLFPTHSDWLAGCKGSLRLALRPFGARLRLRSACGLVQALAACQPVAKPCVEAVRLKPKRKGKTMKTNTQTENLFRYAGFLDVNTEVQSDSMRVLRKAFMGLVVVLFMSSCALAAVAGHVIGTMMYTASITSVLDKG